MHDIRYEHERKDEWLQRGSKSEEETGDGKRANLRWSRSGSGKHTKTKPMVLFTFNIPSHFEETGAVSEGSAKRVQHVAVMTPGLDVSQSDMCDPIILRCDKGNVLTI